MSNVVYKLTHLQNANESHIGMTFQHLATRPQEHLHATNNKTAIAQHIDLSSFCGNCNLGFGSFKILRQFKNDYEPKIQEALPIKKLKPKWITELYTNGSSFLLNVF